MVRHLVKFVILFS